MILFYAAGGNLKNLREVYKAPISRVVMWGLMNLKRDA
jgi:hypothetical protein